MLKIGEFSKLSRITIKTLRYYDEIGLLKPDVINQENGYRFYSVGKLAAAEEIQLLKRMNFSLEEIVAIQNDRPDERNMTNLLLIKREELTAELRKAEDRLKVINFRLQQLEGTAPLDSVLIKKMPSVLVVSYRGIVGTVVDLGGFASEMESKLWRQQIECTNPEYSFSIYHDEEYKEESIDVEICQTVVKRYPDKDGLVFKKLPEIAEAACILHRGGYDMLDDSYSKLYKWLDENDYEIAGDTRECYIAGSWNQANEADWVTEIQIPVEKPVWD